MDVSTHDSRLRPRTLRAARALLAWSHKDLEQASRISKRVIAAFERGQSGDEVGAEEAVLRGALEQSGIEFHPDGSVSGPSIAVPPSRPRAGCPSRWVTSHDLKVWADSLDGAAGLPTLMSALVRAELGSAVQVRFPSGEGIRLPGWDGQTYAETAGPNVPSGKAAWELGAQRDHITKKANEDYGKRTSCPGTLNPKDTTFVFVTPRAWGRKDAWVEEKRAEGVWRDVRAFDGEDLVHWIEQVPAVGAWLAGKLNKRPAGTREVEQLWEEWSHASRPPLSEELVLVDRDEDAAKLLRWLRAEPDVLHIQASSSEEVVAFYHAVLNELPDGTNQAYRARTLVAVTSEAARAFIHSTSPLIVLLTAADVGLARSLADRQHHVLLACPADVASRDEIARLARPSREGITWALMASGLRESQARAVARDCARDMTVLRRLLPGAAERVPAWAAPAPPRALLMAMLAGGWDEANPRETRCLSELAGMAYDTFVAQLTPYVNQPDSPLQKIGTTWRMASPLDAWMLLAGLLTSAELGRFEHTALDVLQAVDPRFDLPANERWLAPFRGITPPYSQLLRKGVGQNLILLGLWGSKAALAPRAERTADRIVEALLNRADARRWWSLSGDFLLLAEASPAAFLGAIECSFRLPEPPIAVLLARDGDALHAAERLHDLTSALEALAWCPKLLPRVALVLARLATMDRRDQKAGVAPAITLRKLYQSGCPQTHATLEERFRALDLLRKHEPEVAWDLLLAVLPGRHSTLSLSRSPRWRDFSAECEEVRSWALLETAAEGISDRLLQDAGRDADRWVALLDRIKTLRPASETVLDALEAIEPSLSDPPSRTALWGHLRCVLHRNRLCVGADWNLEEHLLARIEHLYERFTPVDPLEQISWLFAPGVDPPVLGDDGFHAVDQRVHTLQVEAVRSCHSRFGDAGIIELCKRCETPGLLGEAVAECGLEPPVVDDLVQKTIGSEAPKEQLFAVGLLQRLVRTRGAQWGSDHFSRGCAAGWSIRALMGVLRALPRHQATWDAASSAGADIEALYWKEQGSIGIPGSDAETIYALGKLTEHGRAYHALTLTPVHLFKRLPTELLIELLDRALDDPLCHSAQGNDFVACQCGAKTILDELEGRGDCSDAQLSILEWKSFGLLEHSDREPKAWHQWLSADPEIFVQLVSAFTEPSAESGVVEAPPANPQLAQAVAGRAYRLLASWRSIPGSRATGTLELETLKSWIDRALSAAQVRGRRAVASWYIGRALAGCAAGSDGAWPAEAVRDVLEEGDEDLLEGFSSGCRKNEGITGRPAQEGGDQERRSAIRYRHWAEIIGYGYPQTCRVLEEMAQGCDDHARWQDERVARHDWEG